MIYQATLKNLKQSLRSIIRIRSYFSDHNTENVDIRNKIIKNQKKTQLLHLEFTNHSFK